MIYPIVPIFLTTVLGAPVTIVGLIEGIAESTASILRVFSGCFSDKLRSRKPFMVVGYGLSALSKAVLAASFHWSMVLGGRFLDRFGKGIRTSARDALISESSEAQYRGSVFGFHRAVDTMGALVGPLIALALLSKFGSQPQVYFLSCRYPFGNWDCTSCCIREGHTKATDIPYEYSFVSVTRRGTGPGFQNISDSQCRICNRK